MANKFHPFKVLKINRETEDSVSIELVPENSDQNPFQFVPGQYLTFRIFVNDEKVRRTYSICSAPHENVLRVGVKEIPQGVFSTYANRKLKEGEILEIMEPMGNFTHNPKAGNENHYLAFAAGSGITPVLSIIKSVLREEPKSRFTLFFGNRKTSSIMFKEEIEGLKNTYLDRFAVYHILSREKSDIPLFEGRINKEKVEKFNNLFFDLNNIDDIFLCGPGPMILSLSDYFSSKGIAEDKIHFELFTTEGFEPAEKVVENAPNIPGETVQVKLRIDGNVYNFEMPKSGVTILDAASETGADVPFSCKGGVCSTCRAKLIEGKVHMDVHYALEKEELDQGFILTCQAKPLTDEIVVDYDIK